jgi:hypothetical protein
MGITRRNFLTVSVGVTAGGALQLLLACTPRDGDGWDAVVELGGQFRDLASVERVGAEALRALGGVDAETLIRRVAPQRGRVVLRAEIRDQHTRGDTLQLKGWRVSRTEAGIYALVALAQRDADASSE